ncbi:MAG: undecaprenyl-diphosphate phosphatase [Cyanobacteria bacterium P01_E01_bin.48]
MIEVLHGELMAIANLIPAVISIKLAVETAPDIQDPSLWQAFIMGAVQGLTEFLPISSTAHLRIVPALLGWPDFGASFSAVIQLGSLVAVFVYFAEDLRNVLTGTWQAFQKRQFDSPEYRIFVGVLIGTLPIVIVGLAVKVMYGSPPRQLSVIAVALIALALVLAWAERRGSRKRQIEDIRISDGIVVGFAQALALIPGVSRSGSTITAGLFLGMKRDMAARYAFLLGIPALALAGMVEFVSDYAPSALPAQALGTLSAFIFSYASIDWLLKFLQTSSTNIFIGYRVALGAFLLVGLAVGFL